MTAGTGYIVQSGDANDITFTKSDAVANVENPTSGQALVGQFSGSAYVPSDGKCYILSSGQWKKVATANSNTVKDYRAYLNVANAEEPSSSAPEIMMDIENDGQTTDIAEAATLHPVRAATHRCWTSTRRTCWGCRTKRKGIGEPGEKERARRADRAPRLVLARVTSRRVFSVRNGPF